MCARCDEDEFYNIETSPCHSLSLVLFLSASSAFVRQMIDLIARWIDRKDNNTTRGCNNHSRRWTADVDECCAARRWPFVAFGWQMKTNTLLHKWSRRDFAHISALSSWLWLRYDPFIFRRLCGNNYCWYTLRFTAEMRRNVSERYTIRSQSRLKYPHVVVVVINGGGLHYFNSNIYLSKFAEVQKLMTNEDEFKLLLVYCYCYNNFSYGWIYKEWERRS